jgi:hypothetical protein
MAESLLVIAEDFGRWPAQLGFAQNMSARAVSPRSHGVPAPEEVAGAEVIVIIGPLAGGDHAQQLGGAVRLAVERGATAICLFPVRLDGHDRAFVRELGPLGVSSRSSGVRVTSRSPSFYDYFRAYGVSATTFTEAANGEVLGAIHGDEAGAICLPVERGVLYLLPYHVASLQASHAPMIDAALRAVTAHQEGGQAAIPEFLDGIRVPGETELLAEISDAERNLDEQRREATRLARFRLLIGTTSGDALEALVIETLNLILSETELRAEDREDVGAEDFWLTASGADVALAEAKGIGSHVRREHVNQVENHRAERDRAVEDLPGLLVINVFRGSEDLDQRGLPVSDDVIRHAVRLNVLVLRTLDLLNLVRQHLAGLHPGASVEEHLRAGGGWLEVTEDQIRLRID